MSLLRLIPAFFVCIPALTGPVATELALRGYSVIPAPRKVVLAQGEIAFGSGWRLDAAAVGSNHPAARSLREDLAEFHGLTLRTGASGSEPVVRLAIARGAVAAPDADGIAGQAYKLVLAPGRVEITGNADAGLFYGVQTFLQLLKAGPDGTLLMPEGTVEDWPAYAWRFLHWDTKHHQDRLTTLKRYIDWSARFKVNRIGFEIEDKFEFPSHPVIGAPGAFTAAELQELVDYGLERYVQVVPQVQSPSHMAFVLKHPEFAALRQDGINYQMCTCDPKSYEVIFSMYDDLIKATKGVDTFFVSTDEVYYAGKCDKCKAPYNPENRSLEWCDFARRARDFLASRNRRMLAWVEYPFQTRHMNLLPPDLINGVLGGDREKIKAEAARGIRQLIYVSMQGSELVFPETLNPGRPSQPAGSTRGHLEGAYETLSNPPAEARPLGVYGAAWDDSGLHSETFWLGWATVAQYGWHPGGAPVAQTMADFFKIYYGPRPAGMSAIYRALQEQARFYQRSWDQVVSKVRPPGYGNPWPEDIVRKDDTLPPPPVPALPGLEFTPVYTDRYGRLIEEAGRFNRENEILREQLAEAMTAVSRNRYSLEVFQSLAEFLGHHTRLLMNLSSIEQSLRAARDAALHNNAKQAVGHLVSAHRRSVAVVAERKAMFGQLTRVWEKSRFPRNRTVNGRKFLHVMDDVKDHWADRRADLSYMTAPEESIGLEEWSRKLAVVIQEFAKKNKVAVRGLEELESEE